MKEEGEVGGTARWGRAKVREKLNVLVFNSEARKNSLS